MKSKLQLMINGKPVLIPIQLSEEQIRQLTAAVNFDEILTGWEEPKIGQKGYYEDEFNNVASFEVTSDKLEFANALYENDNYFTNKEIAEVTVRSDNVLRRLRHFALTHRRGELNTREGGYTITYNYVDECLELGATGNWLALGDIVFDDEDTARKAMNKYATDLIWYFTVAKQLV